MNDEESCVKRFMAHQEENPDDWEIRKIPEQSHYIDIEAVHLRSGNKIEFQVTKFDPEKVADEEMHGRSDRSRDLELFVSIACRRIQDKETHYGRDNTLNLVLLLEQLKDFPFGFDKLLEKRFSEIIFESFREIYIVCPAYNVKIK
ncbi:hypothetical protein ACFL6Y_08655 [Elusimicrobiota bacterium]